MFHAAARRAPTNTDAEAHRLAYNAAFNDLGLSWFWDAETHTHLQANADERDRIRIYLETHQSHLLTAYDAEFLVNAIHSNKQRRLERLSA